METLHIGTSAAKLARFDEDGDYAHLKQFAEAHPQMAQSDIPKEYARYLVDSLDYDRIEKIVTWWARNRVKDLHKDIPAGASPHYVERAKGIIQSTAIKSTMARRTREEIKAETSALAKALAKENADSIQAFAFRQLLDTELPNGIKLRDATVGEARAYLQTKSEAVRYLLRVLYGRPDNDRVSDVLSSAKLSSYV